MAAENKDPKGLYATLGVDASADSAEIRKAYRRLALRWHPDKNPDDETATAQFQKISAAYEVLMDPPRREMYDSTGCIDAEELDDSADLDHATDLFAAFFGRGFAEDDDLDEEEQAMLDEFLRMATGGSAFRRRGKGKAKKGGRGGRRKAGGSCGSCPSMGRAMSMEEMLMASMGEMSMPAQPCCEQGHPLKKRKADEDYECDLCGSDILEGKKFWDCRKCDWSMCLKCQKAIEEEAALAEEEMQESQILEAFIEMHTQTVREGKRLAFRCQICKATFHQEETLIQHMEDKHRKELEAFIDDCDGSFGMGPGIDPIAAMMMGGMEEMLFAGAFGDAPTGAKAKGRKPKKKK
eukprot:gnl/TRDRNA2_/TRDRNA2_193403_c0_seq1.p1 gnl/TRDRNA2_/TRDRNA2_193403_c0~~gnl/TRDRNA2_/TRDRNA2_193403_c0_seq1.p1  ORF type:complete len:366 (+),score=101.19 gnl/TRDRNA2_/TRDRNA2_193403_c0_seq1:48-1100(+)